MDKFKLTTILEDAELWKLVKNTDKNTLAYWAIECSERVLPFFEEKYPSDKRPRAAINTLKEWIKTGIFKMSVIRKASLDSHTAAREIKEDNAAKSAARAAGQAVATAHVQTHSIGAANYALQAIFRSSQPMIAKEAVAKEKEWQLQRLKELRQSRK